MSHKIVGRFSIRNKFSSACKTVYPNTRKTVLFTTKKLTLAWPPPVRRNLNAQFHVKEKDTILPIFFAKILVL